MDNNSVENVSGKKAAEKLKELTDSARACMMMTALDKRPLSARPMSILKTDEEGRFYFLTSKDSEVVTEIRISDEMHITVSNDKSSEYLSIYGHAEAYRDQSQIDELYSPIANTWFDGKEDQNIRVIRFSPETGHYWDSKNGKLIQLAGFMIGAITGKPADNGRQGDINI